MSVQHDFTIPEFSLGDRLALTLRVHHLNESDAAQVFGLHRNTISNWIHGRTNPSLSNLRMWAFWAGVPLVWLQTGERPPEGSPGDLLPRLDSNQEPAVYPFVEEDNPFAEELTAA